jgi:PiT family inorganic phosphate transporter
MASFPSFVQALLSNPLLALTMVLIAGTIFINGSTDAANAIAEAVGTRSISFGRAVIMAMLCDFMGLLISVSISAAVADTMSGMVDFGGDTHAALVALAAAMVAIEVWSGVAWAFGIPTSESHALIAGISGSAIALQGGIEGINFAEWVKVLTGLGLSVVGGFALGFLLCRLIRVLFVDVPYRAANKFFGRVQVFGAGFCAFMHGAQDGQKFLSIACMAVALAEGNSQVAGQEFPIWLMVACASILAVGVGVGGKKIVKTVGTKMVRMEKYQGAAASISAGLSLLAATYGGMPVSTTHTKTAAIMGAGASRSIKSVNWNIAKDMVLTWVLTFPGCGLIGYLLSLLFLRIF